MCASYLFCVCASRIYQLFIHSTGSVNRTDVALTKPCYTATAVCANGHGLLKIKTVHSAKHINTEQRNAFI